MAPRLFEHFEAFAPHGAAILNLINAAGPRCVPTRNSHTTDPIWDGSESDFVCLEDETLFVAREGISAEETKKEDIEFVQ